MCCLVGTVRPDEMLSQGIDHIPHGCKRFCDITGEQAVIVQKITHCAVISKAFTMFKLKIYY